MLFCCWLTDVSIYFQGSHKSGPKEMASLSYCVSRLAGSLSKLNLQQTVPAISAAAISSKLILTELQLK